MKRHWVNMEHEHDDGFEADVDHRARVRAEREEEDSQNQEQQEDEENVRRRRNEEDEGRRDDCEGGRSDDWSNEEFIASLIMLGIGILGSLFGLFKRDEKKEKDDSVKSMKSFYDDRAIRMTEEAKEQPLNLTIERANSSEREQRLLFYQKMMKIKKNRQNEKRGED